MSSLVAVDIGNSSIKLGWFPEGESRTELPSARVLTFIEDELESPPWNAFCEMIDSQTHWVDRKSVV